VLENHKCGEHEQNSFNPQRYFEDVSKLLRDFATHLDSL
jgi:hypothetical protein